jgi:prephenate dehydrogenase
MTPSQHDKLIALTSHLPYAVALALMNIAGQNKSKYLHYLIGGSFKSATRVAKSSPTLTMDMFKTNQKEISGAIDLMINELLALKKSINSGSQSRLMSIINKAQKERIILSDE